MFGERQETEEAAAASLERLVPAAAAPRGTAGASSSFSLSSLQLSSCRDRLSALHCNEIQEAREAKEMQCRALRGRARALLPIRHYRACRTLKPASTAIRNKSTSTALDPEPISCKTDIKTSRPPPNASAKASKKPRERLKVVDETSIAGAQHKPSIGGASFAHLVSELSATTPQMLRDGVRVEGQTMDEASRASVRRTAKWLMGFPLVVGGLWVAVEWSKGHFNAAGGSKATGPDK